MPQQNKYRRAIETVKAIKNNDLLKLSTYRLLPIDERFAKIMRLYDKVSTEWKSEYKKIERKKPKEIRTPIPSENIEDIINGALYDDILEVVLSIHVANKIAHASICAKETIIKKFIENKIEYNKLDKSLIEKEKLNIITKRISIIYDKVNEENSVVTQISKSSLLEYGITPEILEELKGKGIEELNELARSAFYIKDFEINNAIKLLRDRSDISYGKMDDDTGHSLVVDLPYYGQFAVHLKTQKSISALSKTPYDELRFYEKESVLLTDEISETAQKYIKRKKEMGKTTLKEILPDLKQVKKDDPRFAHYVALKMGATKQELDELYNEERKTKSTIIPNRKRDNRGISR